LRFETWDSLPTMEWEELRRQAAGK